MRIAITGASGLLGQRLIEHLAAHDVVPAGRRGDGLTWDPEHGLVRPDEWEGFDGVIHLAGETIGQRWSPATKARIMASRAGGTRALSEGLARLASPPSWFISASAVGWYGDAGDQECNEAAPPGEGFLADVVAQWEAAAEPARNAGIRVAHPRTGIVLARNGGALERMMLPFKLGMGGPMGSGRQWFPWIHIDDWCRAIVHLTQEGDGPVNVTAPGPVPQKAFAKALGKALRRPAFMPLPGFAVRLMFGQMGQELLLWGQNAPPSKLEEMGFMFIHPDLQEALDDVVG